MFRLLALLALFLTAQTSPPVPVPSPAPGGDEVRVLITTSAGPVTLALDRGHAPMTTANFLRYVDARRFDGTTFYRAMKLRDGLGLVQGGLRNDPRKLFPPVAHEPTSQTGLHNDDMAISMARDRPGNATADFFICVGDLSSLDADPKNADPAGFAAFGHVVEGQDVVRAILSMPTGTSGPPGMQGQMLAPPVRILTARRVP